MIFNEVEMPDFHKTVAHMLGKISYRRAWIRKRHNMPPCADFGFDNVELSDGWNTPFLDDDYLR